MQSVAHELHRLRICRSNGLGNRCERAAPLGFCVETHSRESGPALTCGANAAQCRAEPDTKMITIIYKIHGLRQGFQKKSDRCVAIGCNEQ